jgi:hypothetical protein
MSDKLFITMPDGSKVQVNRYPIPQDESEPPYPVTIIESERTGKSFELTFNGLYSKDRLPRKLKKRIKKEFVIWALQFRS